MVVAQVDSTVITFSELLSETRLVLLRTGGPELARAQNLDQKLLNAVLRSIVVRELVLGEVRRLKLRDVPDSEVKAAIEQLRRRFVTPADFERFLEKSGFSEPGTEKMRELEAPASLVATVTADLSLERFLEVRVRRNLVARDSELIACYEANHDYFEGKPFALVKDELKQKLEEEQRDRAIENMVAGLERRAMVRYTPGFEPPPREPAEEAGFHCPEAHAPELRE